MKRTLLLASLMVLSFALSAGAQSSQVLLKSGDTVAIFVWHAPELSVKAAVVTDGKIELPLLGKVQAEGLSPAELKQLIVGRYSKYVNAPNVAVILDRISR